LHHPNIVSVFDLRVRPDGLAYMVQELVRGVTLRAKMSGPDGLSHTEVVMIAEALGAALERARQAGAQMGAVPLLEYARLEAGMQALAYGDIQVAREDLRLALAVARETSEYNLMVEALDGLAVLAAREGKARHAMRLAGAADGIRRRHNVYLRASLRRAQREALAGARDVLGDEWKLEYDRGRLTRSDTVPLDV
jgi:hypothetical protein